jgi:hypothetical protein
MIQTAPVHCLEAYVPGLEAYVPAPFPALRGMEDSTVSQSGYAGAFGNRNAAYCSWQRIKSAPECATHSSIQQSPPEAMDLGLARVQSDC